MLWLLLLLFVDGVLPLELLDWLSRIRSGSCSESGSSGSGSGSGMNCESEGASLMGRLVCGTGPGPLGLRLGRGWLGWRFVIWRC